jgi:hypothetical protein
MQGGKMKINEILESKNNLQQETERQQLDQSTKDILQKYFKILGPSIINADRTVDILGTVELIKPTNKLPIKFDKVAKFFCSDGGLTSLTNAPRWIDGAFQCRANRIISLEFGPEHVGGDYVCENNPLVSLAGFPKSLIGTFVCTWSPDLPLLQSIQAMGGVYICNRNGTKHPTTDIINKARNNDNLRHAVLDAQRALIEAGFSGNARW